MKKLYSTSDGFINESCLHWLLIVASVFKKGKYYRINYLGKVATIVLVLIAFTAVSNAFAQTNYAPVASNVTANRINNIGRQLIRPLQGTDAEGQVLTYIITDLNLGVGGGNRGVSGSLHKGNVTGVLVVGDILSASEVQNLFYTPPTSQQGNQTATLVNGTHSFTYVVNDGVNNSTPATYYLPVGQAPVPSPTSMIISPVLNTAGEISIPSPSATGGAINGYIIVRPATTQGQLHYSTTPTGVKTLVGSTAATVNSATVFLWFTPSASYEGIATFTYVARNGDGNTTTAANQATYSIPVYSKRPVVSNVTTVAIPKTAGEKPINPLTATAILETTISSFIISNLPTASAGTLRINGSPATAGTYSATNGQLAGLTFEPNPNLGSGTTSVTFSFQATNNEGAISSGTAIYTIPIPNDNASVYSVAKTSFNKDALSNGIILATLADADGGIVSASAVTVMPNGMALNPSTGAITVSNIDELSAGEYTRYINTVDAKGGKSYITVVINIVNDREAVYTTTNTFFTNVGQGVTLATVSDLDGAIVNASATGLESWMTLNPTTGAITRNGSAAIPAGAYTKIIKILDAAGGKSDAEVTIVINNATASYNYISQHYSIYALKPNTVVGTAVLSSGAAISTATLAPGATALPSFLRLNPDGSIAVNTNKVVVGKYSSIIRLNGSIDAPVVIDVNDDIYQINNEAFKLGDNNYRLTTAEANKRGEVWKTTPVDLSKSFEITFKANFGSIDANGADGIAFALQRHGSNPLFAYGQTGEGLGVGHGASTANPRTGGISPSVVVEFDTWQNTAVAASIEPVYDHLAVFLNGEERAPVTPVVPMKGTTAAPVNVEDGANHLVKIIWNKATNKLSVYFDNSLRTEYSSDLIANVFGNNPMVYFGYSASTGASMNEQKISEINFSLLDTDGDGFADASDLDSDNDGISNLVESGKDNNGNFINPFGDQNNDGLTNYKDPVFCASIGSFLNNKGVCASLDVDGDGLINALDLDSDNDGIPDAVEANDGVLKSNMTLSGQYPVSFYSVQTDTDRNGMIDAVQGENALLNGDKDGDGIPNALDLDSDGDGIVDAVEANNGVLPADMTLNGQYSVAFMFLNDLNLDGINDALAANPLFTKDRDMDQDDLFNFLDLDSDNDGLPDVLEAQDQNRMVVKKGLDINRNGIDDAYDVIISGGAALTPLNTDGDSNPDFLDLDSDNDLFLDFEEAFDKNGDGKSEDDFIKMASEFGERVNDKTIYTLTPEKNGRPIWLAYASDSRLNLLSTKSSLPALYRDVNRNGLVDLFDSQAFGEESTVSTTNYSFRSAGANVPLPVKLINFSGSQKIGGIQLKWATAAEKDNDFFQVERSQDGKAFALIGQVKGNGTSNVLQSYSFVDASAPAGTVYYRLKQVDFDGKFEYSKVIALKADGKTNAQASLSVYPNPTSGKVFFTSAELEGAATVTLYNANGRAISQKQVELKVGEPIALDLSAQAAGVYYLQVQTDVNKVTTRVVKQ
ncbi:lectin-like domain-containing protein [Rufibacter latericius]|nr:T9SS type A sorting domain-containing protein [Rufibacter latericius]